MVFLEEIARSSAERKEDGGREETIDDTFLSQCLNDWIEAWGFNVAELQSFCWTRPEEFVGLPLPGDRSSPVPRPTNQRNTCFCISHAINGLVKLQTNLISRFSGGVIPVIPSSYFVSLYLSLPPNDRTIETMLTRLHDDGFVASRRSHPRQAGAQIYYIHWCKGMERLAYVEEKATRQFDTEVKECIVRHGGVLGEILMTDDFDYSGNKIATAKGRKVKVTGAQGAEDRKLGHAVVIVGWENYKNTVRYKYLNSHGSGFGEGGFGWAYSGALYHVYVPQVLRW